MTTTSLGSDQQWIPSPRTATVKLMQHASMEQFTNTPPLHEKTEKTTTTWFNTYMHVCGPCRPPMFLYCLTVSLYWGYYAIYPVTQPRQLGGRNVCHPTQCKWSGGLKRLITLTLVTAAAPCVCDNRLGQETSLCQPKERISPHRITIFYHADGLVSDAASIPTNHRSLVHSLDHFPLPGRFH